MAEHVFPVPKPWYNSKELYGVLNDKKFLTKSWCGANSNSALHSFSECSSILLIVPSYLLSLNSFFSAILILNFGSFRLGYRYWYLSSFNVSLSFEIELTCDSRLEHLNCRRVISRSFVCLSLLRRFFLILLNHNLIL